MMINKRLIRTVDDSKKYIARNVLFQWCSLIANITIIFSVSIFLQKLWDNALNAQTTVCLSVTAVLSIAVRFLCSYMASRAGYLSSHSVKKVLRRKIYEKMLRLGPSYTEQLSTAETVQMAVEGVDQLETYFGAYLPQFFYSMLAPVTLFTVLAFLNLPSAAVLLICVPLIPAAIAAVQTFAKKLLARYWDQYTTLGDSFLENLQGLTTLKIYQSDGIKNEEMNKEAKNFRRITMKVLTMQLNSITIMDLVAYGGAALGIILAVSQFYAGHVGFVGCLSILLLSADFFLPMRQLGSYFHIAMNGMAASDRIFHLLDLPEPGCQTDRLTGNSLSLSCSHIQFSYTEDRPILKDVSMEFPAGSFTGIAGESGCGKSTLAALLSGRIRGYEGEVSIGGLPLSVISQEDLSRNITYVGHNSYLFKGTVRDNLAMGRPDAGEDEMWAVLERARLAQFLHEQQGLDTAVAEKGSNLSGGQCQRLAFARALLHDSPVYIFDEATSNIDVESENDIMSQIYELAGSKNVLLISHRLANLTGADIIYCMDRGRVVESGNHRTLLEQQGIYKKLWMSQQALEHFTREDAV